MLKNQKLVNNIRYEKDIHIPEIKLNLNEYIFLNNPNKVEILERKKYDITNQKIERFENNISINDSKKNKNITEIKPNYIEIIKRNEYDLKNKECILLKNKYLNNLFNLDYLLKIEKKKIKEKNNSIKKILNKRLKDRIELKERNKLKEMIKLKVKRNNKIFNIKPKILKPIQKEIFLIYNF
jgi:hypothetical protein